MTTLKERITEDMKAAMRASEKERLSTIRMLQAAIKQREVDERITLDDAQVLAIIEKMVKQRKESIVQFEAGGRPDLADKEKSEIAQLQDYLPAQLCDAEIDALIKEAIASTGAASVKDMGKVMGVVKAQGGRACRHGRGERPHQGCPRRLSRVFGGCARNALGRGPPAAELEVLRGFFSAPRGAAGNLRTRLPASRRSPSRDPEAANWPRALATAPPHPHYRLRQHGPRIPQHFIDELVARTDIIEVIGSRVQLKTRRPGIQGLLPVPRREDHRRSPSAPTSSSITASAAARTARCSASSWITTTSASSRPSRNSRRAPGWRCHAKVAPRRACAPATTSCTSRWNARRCSIRQSLSGESTARDYVQAPRTRRRTACSASASATRRPSGTACSSAMAPPTTSARSAACGPHHRAAGRRGRASTRRAIAAFTTAFATASCSRSATHAGARSHSAVACSTRASRST